MTYPINEFRLSLRKFMTSPINESRTCSNFLIRRPGELLCKQSSLVSTEIHDRIKTSQRNSRERKWIESNLRLRNSKLRGFNH